jgi:hypothetical protein
MSTCTRTLATTYIYTPQPNSCSPPIKGGRSGKDSYGPCPFFYDRYLPN